jgi:hypothetical protein
MAWRKPPDVQSQRLRKCEPTSHLCTRTQGIFLIDLHHPGRDCNVIVVPQRWHANVRVVGALSCPKMLGITRASCINFPHFGQVGRSIGSVGMGRPSAALKLQASRKGRANNLKGPRDPVASKFERPVAENAAGGRARKPRRGPSLDVGIRIFGSAISSGRSATHESRQKKRPARCPGGALGAGQSLFCLRLRDQMRLKASPSSTRLA